MALTREQLLENIAARKRETVTMEVPEWGGEIHLRRLTAGDLKETGFLDQAEDRDALQMFSKLLAATIADENGERLFSEDDVTAFVDADFVTIMKVFTKVAEVNGLPVGDLDEAMKAFDGAQRDDSSTD